MAGDVPLWIHHEWAERFPWLVQATTGAGDEAEPFDLGLFGQQPVGAAMRRWRLLRETLAMPGAVHSHQIHGAEVRVHRHPVDGLLVIDGFDAHVTAEPGLLLTISIADCVPVFVVDPERRAVGIAHAGWRGTASGVLERTVSTMVREMGSDPRSLYLHLGPSICGDCYEVGPEVHAGVHPHRPPPEAPAPIDLRDALAVRSAAAGVPVANTSVSTHCSRCSEGAFFSHRGGSRARQIGVIGLRR